MITECCRSCIHILLNFRFVGLFNVQCEIGSSQIEIVVWILLKNIGLPLTQKLFGDEWKTVLKFERKIPKTCLTIENVFVNKFINITLDLPERKKLHSFNHSNKLWHHTRHAHLSLRVLQGLCVQSQSRNWVRVDARILRQAEMPKVTK